MCVERHILISKRHGCAQCCSLLLRRHDATRLWMVVLNRWTLPFWGPWPRWKKINFSVPFPVPGETKTKCQNGFRQSQKGKSPSRFAADGRNSSPVFMHILLNRCKEKFLSMQWFPTTITRFYVPSLPKSQIEITNMSSRWKWNGERVDPKESIGNCIGEWRV